MKTIYFITSNKGKLNETKEKLSKVNIKIIQRNVGYNEIQANTLEEVAIFGVKQVQERFEHPVIIEDAGLFIDDLNGFPGVYSSYIYHTIGCSGILKLLGEIDINRRNACFKSIYAYAEPGKKSKLFKGECPGVISKRKLGDNGFGYDPIFIPNGCNRTFAQMSTKEKNCYSHRGKSIEKMIDFLNKKKILMN